MRTRILCLVRGPVKLGRGRGVVIRHGSGLPALTDPSGAIEALTLLADDIEAEGGDYGGYWADKLRREVEKL